MVWGILADFGMYRRRDPLIRGILGHAESGRRIEVRFASSPRAEIALRLTIGYLRKEQAMTWIEWWAVRGLFVSERRFRLEPLPSGVRFRRGEQVRGSMVPLPGKRCRLRRRAGFDAMNAALKRRAEHAWAQASPAEN